MKRPAMCLFLSVAVCGWTATGYAKKGGGKAAAAAPASADDNAGGGEDQKAAPAGDEKAGGESAPASESLTEDQNQPGAVEEEIGGPKEAARPTTTLSWQDIVVVPRKAFIKSGRFELQPFTGVTVNDNLIRHYVFGADLNFFLTDVFWVGLQGQYFIKQLTNQEELVGLQFNRASSLNKYLYGGALNFGYVPVYGKFALFNKSIVHWEIWASAGIGATVTEVLPRDPANASLAFKNTDLTPNVGLGTRLFLLDWLTVNLALRDYIIPDHFEPLPNGTQANPPITNSADAKSRADSQLVNNVIVYLGVGFYLPTKFTYKTPR
jgi:outer membrane beta-barrel protein